MDGIADSLLKPDYYYCFLVKICVILWFGKQIQKPYRLKHLQVPRDNGKAGIISSHRRQFLRPDPPDDSVFGLMTVDILNSKRSLAHTDYFAL